MDTPFSLDGFPKAIVHLDADAFFASCEQAIHPEYRGKPVITGKERGIVAAVSYEAKKFGIERGVPLWQVKKMCPGAIVVPSDYETYSLFSARMFSIMRRFTPEVEEYSIDEAFADLTGLQRPYHRSYRDIARMMKESIEKELGITVSVGLSVSKVLAKIGSKHQKPAGFTAIPAQDIYHYLRNLPLQKVWGIGEKTAAYMVKLGITTAWEYARKREAYLVAHKMDKPRMEIWQELNGRSIYPVQIAEKEQYQSISKTKTFTPPSRERAYVFAQLVKNLENACIKARRHHISAKTVIVYLKTQDYHHRGIEGRLNRASAFPLDMMGVVREMFEAIYEDHILYRATGVVLCNIVPDTSLQMTLFEPAVRIEQMKKVFEAVDTLSDRYGKHTVYVAASEKVQCTPQHVRERGDIPIRKLSRLEGESARQHVDIPLLMSVVR